MLPPLEDLYVISADFRRTSVDFREMLAYGFQPAAAPERMLVEYAGVREALWLETCDRVEAVVLADTEETATTAVQEMWENKTGMKVAHWWERFFVHRATGAFRHLARIASGLDLAYPGSHYVMEQLRMALARSEQAGSMGATLRTLTTTVLQIAERVAAGEAEAEGAPWPATRAVLAMLARYYGPLSNRTGLMVGTGLLAENLCRALGHEGIQLQLTGGGSRPTSIVARQLALDTFPLTEVGSMLSRFDFVVAATSLLDRMFPVLTVPALPDLAQNRSLLAIDLSFPRVLRAESGTGIFLYDTDHLSRQWRERKESAVPQREARVMSELSALFQIPFPTRVKPRTLAS